ncbi:DUF2834 domain-containing protein [Arthrobacter cheniae]|uniref:DUF2834 domain-containing protein n=1 Tax=Arthrobacter cheniae TaxID=1258888 RepID=UPI001F2AAC04|nr:DUF2834 domain-containing protein [Arthrobacter cheniae]
MRLVYLILGLIGLVGTWFFNLRSMAAGENYLAGWFANAAASSAAVDVIVVAVVACVFMVVEGHRRGMSRAVWLLVPLSFAVAIAFTFPLFLAWREHHLLKIATDTAATGRQPVAP